MGAMKSFKRPHLFFELSRYSTFPFHANTHVAISSPRDPPPPPSPSTAAWRVMTDIEESHSPQNTGLIASAATAPVAVVSAEPGRYRRVGGRGQTAGGRRALSQLEETLTETPVERLDGRGRQLSVHLQTVLQDRQLTGRGAQRSHRGQTCCRAGGGGGKQGSDLLSGRGGGEGSTGVTQSTGWDIRRSVQSGHS